MDKDFIENTTFSKICKLMNRESNIDKNLVKSVFDVSLLFLPSIMCPEVAPLTSIATGVSLVGAKNIITNFGAQLKGLFTHDKNNDYATCYERAQTAQVLLVFSAYFDVIRAYLPKIFLSRKTAEHYAIRKACCWNLRKPGAVHRLKKMWAVLFLQRCVIQKPVVYHYYCLGVLAQEKLCFAICLHRRFFVMNIIFL